MFNMYFGLALDALVGKSLHSLHLFGRKKSVKRNRYYTVLNIKNNTKLNERFKVHVSLPIN